MDPPILQDPAHDIRPDFASGRYAGRRNAVAAGEQLDVAVGRLNALWDDEHAERVAAWDAQQNAVQVEAANALEAQRLEEQRLQEEARAKRAENAPKVPDFDDNSQPPDSIPLQPSTFAMNKLTKMEAVELWYFGIEGCQEAALQTTDATDAFGLARGEAGVVFRPMMAQTPSRKAIPDSTLSWSQMMVASTGFIAALGTCKYPDKHCQAMAQFYVLLQHHRLRFEPYGDLILVEYNSRALRAWFLALKSGDMFNIGNINDKLLAAATDAVLGKLRTDGIQRYVFSP
ncbi:hypothetical protein OF83DRAFT_1273181, partial [Amylostereum chailletii]